MIFIAKRPNLVFVKGEVNNPGIRKFVPGKRLRYYIDATGGYTPDADKGNVFVQLPNGDSFKLNQLSLFSPRVMDGSIVTVGKLPEEKPIDKTEVAKEIASILADLAQVVVMVLLVMDKLVQLTQVVVEQEVLIIMVVVVLQVVQEVQVS